MEKNARFELNERKPMIPNVKVSSQPMTSEVRSNTRSGPFETTMYLLDPIKSTVNTLKHSGIDIRRKLSHFRSSEVSDLMT